MCLKIVDKDTKEVTEGWKVFKVSDDKLYGTYIPYKFETNKWIKDSSNYFIELNKNIKYRTGFHFYLNKKDAEDEARYWRIWNKKHKFVIKKVKVRNVTATGKQNSHRVGVAREIFIEDHN